MYQQRTDQITDVIDLLVLIKQDKIKLTTLRPSYRGKVRIEINQALAHQGCR